MDIELKNRGPPIFDEKKIPRPSGFMENPYIGRDGRDYHSVKALGVANADYVRRTYVKIQPLTEQFCR